MSLADTISRSHLNNLNPHQNHAVKLKVRIIISGIIVAAKMVRTHYLLPIAPNKRPKRTHICKFKAQKFHQLQAFQMYFDHEKNFIILIC